ncbi:MAG: hypothetical protein ACRDNH_01420 [Gaiellaceae bacterium]
MSTRSKLHFVASVPERLIRSTAALLGGAVHETAQLLLPRLIRVSRLYEVSAKNLLRILVEGVGAVEGSSTADPNAPAAGEIAVRKGAGNVVELGSFLAFGFSPLWLLAAASDVTRGSRVYLRELVEELKAARIVAEELDVGSVDELLAVLEGTSGRTARLIDLPPLELEELRTSLAELRAGASELPSQEELARVYRGLRLEAVSEDRSLLEVSSGIGLAFLLSAKNVSRTHLVAPYRKDWEPLREEGFGAYARRVGRPYAEAVAGHFDSDRETYTQWLLTRNDPGTEFRFCDEMEGGFGWQVDERMERTSHAVVAENGVWLFDPLVWEPALERIAELGRPAGVIQLLDRHERDSATIAAALGVPHFAVPPHDLPGSGIELVQVVSSRFWRELGAWIPSRRTLVCADALGSAAYFHAANEPIGVHPLLRLKPPRVLARYEPEHILCGHGAGVHGPDAPQALREALRTARRRLPRALAHAFKR